MEEFPVRLLTELLTTDEILTAEGVRDTHNVLYNPVGVCLPYESCIANYRTGKEQFSEFRYTPRTYYAIRVWEAASEELLSQKEFAGVLDIEWQPIAATFNSIRYVNGYPEVFIRRMFETMERIANSGTIEIKYGRFDAPATKELPDYPRRYYIMPSDILASKRAFSMGNELDSMQDKPAERMSWEDIKDAFVILKPIQLAFIAGDLMNRHTPLDDEFINACVHFDFEKVKELVGKGANIHAATEYGDTALSEMTLCYHETNEVDENGYSVRDNRNHDNYIRIAEYLLSLGYNINITGYCECTALYHANFVDDLDIARFLLDNGADPNAPSYIGDEHSLGMTPLSKAWMDRDFYPESKCGELAEILLRRGGLPVPKDERYEGDLNKWIEKLLEDGEWDSSNCENMSMIDKAIIHSARGLWFYKLVLLSQSGGNINLRDNLGRNLLQIALDEAQPNPKLGVDLFQERLMEMSLMLLCGLKLHLSDEEMEQAKQTCRRKGYAKALEAIESVKNANGHL